MQWGAAEGTGFPVTDHSGQNQHLSHQRKLTSQSPRGLEKEGPEVGAPLCCGLKAVFPKLNWDPSFPYDGIGGGAAGRCIGLDRDMRVGSS
jgi:hypothetical protein